MTFSTRAVRRTDAMAWVNMRHDLWPHAGLDDLSLTVDAFFDGGTPLIAAAFLACDGDAALGFIEVSLRPYVPGTHAVPAPFVEGWYVRPEFRGRGVGRALVRAAEAWARERGDRHLGSDAQVENTASAAAHRALGFRVVETVHFFVKEL